MREKPKLYALVLAGGMSRRMGADKAQLLHPDGRTMLQRTIDLVREVSDMTYISLRADQSIPRECQDGSTSILRDPEVGGDGPMAAIIEALQREPSALWCVVSCDLPRLDAVTLRHLCREWREDEAFLAYRSEFDGLPEPLCTLYAPGALKHFLEAREKQFCCPRKVLIRQECRLLEPIVPRALENANTPEDWKLSLI